MNNPGGSIGSSDGSHSLEPSHPPEDEEGGIPHNLSDPQLAPQDDEPQQDDNIMEEDAGDTTATNTASAITSHDNNSQQQALNNLPIENSGTSQQPSANNNHPQPTTSIKDSKLTIQLPSTLPSSQPPSTLPSSSQPPQQTQNQQSANSSSYTDTVINGESMNNLAMNSPLIKTQLLPQIQEGGIGKSGFGGIGMLPHQKLSSTGSQQQGQTGRREGQRGREGGQTSGEKSIEISSTSNHTLGSQGRVDRTVDEVQNMMGPYRANTPGDMSLSSEISSTAMTQHHQPQQRQGTTISTGRYGSPAIEGIATTTSTPAATTITGGIKAQEDNNNTQAGNEATAAHERRQSGKLSPRASQSNDNNNNRTRGLISSGPNMTLERLSYILGRGSLIMVSSLFLMCALY